MMTTFLQRSQVSLETNIKAFCGNGAGGFTNVGIVVLACVCVVLPLDVSQLAFAVVGALVFAFLQSSHPKPKRNSLPCKRVCSVPSPRSGPVHRTDQRRNLNRRPSDRADTKRPSAAPIQAPIFENSDWDLQVTELLKQISPSVDDDKIVGKIAFLVKQVINPMFPDVEVVGFTSGDLSRKKAFGVAVPDVDIVANVNPAVLAEQLTARLGFLHGPMDAKKLQKSAIRLCTDKLVSDAGFKFRRSAFRGDEPKVTLMVPALSELGIDAIPINFLINAVSPLHNAALLTECGILDSRARELILLVKRWAKDRGICHAAKGHLSPYGWTILCIFFLQAGMSSDESLLPPLSGFKKASCLMNPEGANMSQATSTGSGKSVSELFCEFLQFYSEKFNWKTEAVSIRAGQRGKPGLCLPLHIIVAEDGKATCVGPSVEDPFQQRHNLADAMTSSSLTRLHEELSRAAHFCSGGAYSLADLLEPWSPPERDSLEQTSENSPDEAIKVTRKLVAPWRQRVHGS